MCRLPKQDIDSHGSWASSIGMLGQHYMAGVSLNALQFQLGANPSVPATTCAWAPHFDVDFRNDRPLLISKLYPWLASLKHIVAEVCALLLYCIVHRSHSRSGCVVLLYCIGHCSHSRRSTIANVACKFHLVISGYLAF